MIRNKDLLLIGEFHGTKETPKFLKNICFKILKNYNINLCLEFPKQLQNDVIKIIDNKKINKNNYKLFKDLILDGRLTPALLENLKYIKSYAIKNNKKCNIFCIDKFTKKIEERDLSMFNFIKNLYLKKDKKTKIIFYGGNFHTSTKEFIFKNKKFIPLGKILKNSNLYNTSFIIFVLPLEGQIFNYKIKNISNKKINSEDDLISIKFIKKVSPSYFTSEMLNKKLFL